MELTEEQINNLRAKAEQEDAEAQYELGWRHALGMGFDQNETEGLKWLRLAAENGHMLAQNNLGARYFQGDGVSKDLVEAYLWFSRAAEQGDRKAGKNRDTVYKELTPDQLEKVKQRG